VKNGLPTGTLTFLFTDVEGSAEAWERRIATMLPTLSSSYRAMPPSATMTVARRPLPSYT